MTFSSGLSERDENTWRDELTDFRDTTYAAVFQPLGFTLPEACVVWWLNCVRNRVADVDTQLRAMSDDDEDDA